MAFDITSETSFDVTLTLGDKKSATCHEILMFANTETWHMETFYGKGEHVLTFNMPSYDEQKDVGLTGISIFNSCYGIVKETESIMRFLEMFVSPTQSLEIPEYMAREDINFLWDSMGYDVQERVGAPEIDIDPLTVKSGDFFGITRLDGLNPLIMYGTGSHIGHCTTALWFDDGLYIVESQGNVLWPV